MSDTCQIWGSKGNAFEGNLYWTIQYRKYCIFLVFNRAVLKMAWIEFSNTESDYWFFSILDVQGTYLICRCHEWCHADFRFFNSCRMSENPRKPSCGNSQNSWNPTTTNIWKTVEKPMKPSKNLWKPLQTVENPWRPLKTFEKPWKTLENCQKSLKTFENIRCQLAEKLNRCNVLACPCMRWLRCNVLACPCMRWLARWLRCSVLACPCIVLACPSMSLHVLAWITRDLGNDREFREFPGNLGQIMRIFTKFWQITRNFGNSSESRGISETLANLADFRKIWANSADFHEIQANHADFGRVTRDLGHFWEFRGFPNNLGKARRLS